MYEIRTDLALEAHEINAQAGREDGIRTEEETIDGFSITTVHVGEGEGERLAKKKAGTYINVDVGKSWLLASEGFAALVALQFGCVIWFLASKRKLAFYILAAAAAVLTVMQLILGGGVGALVYILGPLAAWLMLRRSWSLLR